MPLGLACKVWPFVRCDLGMQAAQQQGNMSKLLASGPGADLAAALTAPPTERLLARRLYASPMASMGTTPSVSAPNAAAARSLRDRLRCLKHLSSTFEVFQRF